MPDLTGLPPKLELHILEAVVLFKLAVEFYSAIKNGGGLVNIIKTFLHGTQTPKP